MEHTNLAAVPPVSPASPKSDQASAARLNLTVFSSEVPPRLTKVFSLSADGSLDKSTMANMWKGSAQRVAVVDLNELALLLDGLSSNQAVGWGIPAGGVEKLDIATSKLEIPEFGLLSRTRRNFTFSKGPGILMLDHDGTPGDPLDCNAFRQQLIDVCPALADAPMLWRPSASAGLRYPDGSSLTDLTRHRLYIPVADSSTIPAVGKALVTLLWAKGLGWHIVGNAGQALSRCLVDASVWQPERLDFAAPPILKDGILRPAETGLVFGDPTGLFDTRQIVASIAEQAEANKNIAISLESVKPSCKTQREHWAASRAPALAHARGISEEKAHGILIRASEHAVLMGDFLLTTSDGVQLSVGQVLDHADHWHNTRFADPLDPDHDLRVAWANLKSGGRPYLYTHRHGGIRFELRRQSSRVQVGKGRRIDATDAVLQVLRDRRELFDFGEGAVAYVAAGRARPVAQDWLVDHLGRVCEFYSLKGTPTGVIEVSEDAPTPVAKAILAKHGERGFKKLSAVVTAPTLRPDGSVLDAPGYDEQSGLLYYTDDPTPPKVPANPTAADALVSLQFLWEPFAKFPLVDAVSRGVVLHGLLTAVTRAALPTAPGIALDAPSAGTGKTLLARCIGILATGGEPSILPPADDDAETRKRLFAALREGSRVLLWDNVREPLGCAALDSFLTAATFSDRILGVSETASLPNRAQFIATGNNIRLTGDTCRRVFLARLDAESERPYARDFDFDPAQRIEADRVQYAVAALTIIRAYITAGRPKMVSGRTASFELWDDLIRQTICWIGTLMTNADRPDIPTFADPLLAAQTAFDQDPETTKHSALMHAWDARFGDKPTTVATAIHSATSPFDLKDEDTESGTALKAALEEIGGQGQRINARIVGRWIERQVGRRIAGLRFERCSKVNGLTTWIVRRDATTYAIEHPKHTKPTGPGKGAGCGDDPEGVFGVDGVFLSDGGEQAIDPDVLALL